MYVNYENISQFNITRFFKFCYRIVCCEKQMPIMNETKC